MASDPSQHAPFRWLAVVALLAIVHAAGATRAAEPPHKAKGIPVVTLEIPESKFASTQTSSEK